MEVTEQCVPVVLFIMLYKVVLKCHCLIFIILQNEKSLVLYLHICLDDSRCGHRAAFLDCNYDESYTHHKKESSNHRQGHKQSAGQSQAFKQL